MNNVKALITIFKRIKYILTKEQKRKSVTVFSSMIICSLLEMLGVSVIYPLLTLMMNSKGEDDDKYVRFFNYIFPNMGTKQIVFVMCIGVGIIFILKNVVALVCVLIQSRYSAKCKKEIQTLMFDSYLRRPYTFFVNNNTGDILRGINGDTTAVYQILLDGFQILAEIITISFIGIYLFMSNWLIATAALFLSAVCFLSIVLGLKGKMKQAGRDYISASGKQFQYSTEAIQGIKEILVMNKRDYFVRQYKRNALIVEKVTVTNSFISACPDRILEGVFIAGFMIVLASVSYNNDIKALVPTVGAFAMGAIKILPSVSKISNRVNDIVYEQKGLENCYYNIKEAKKIAIENINSDEINVLSSEKLKFNKSLEIKNISFCYSDNSRKIFDNMSMKINKGDSVAFIGQSGAGKTTLADIILGLYRPNKGTIELDGVCYDKLKGLWNTVIGYVPQATFLLNDTVRKNVAFGTDDEKIEDERIWQALEKAQLKEFVMGLSKGLDTTVGDRGVKFSGGQRQRLAIARVLYNDPDIIILDEATSALDNETEAAVMEAIDALKGEKTLIIVAHRLSTVKNCNKVYEIGDGKAVEVNV